MIVFDASALLALAKREAGASLVSQHLNIGHISAVNASEFVQKLNRYGDEGQKAFEKLEQVGLELHELTRADAYAAAQLYPVSKPYGLSLADRCCLVLAKRLAATVYTADKAWANVSKPLSLDIQVIR